MSSSQAFLTLDNGTEVSIRDACSIGRSSENHLILSGEGISRRHALIHNQGNDGYWIVDLGSSNGTQVNNRPVARPLKLATGDLIRIGTDFLRFSAAGSESVVDSLAGPTLLEVRVSPQWVIVADIADFTPLSQRLNSADLAHTVGSWIAETRAVMQRHDGVIHKYLGDGWLGGWPVDQPAQVAETLTALREIQDGSELSFRLAIHFGKITTSGAGTAGEQEMIGPELNFLFRMEKIGAIAGVACLLSATAHEKLVCHYSAKSIGHFSLKGFEGEYEFFS